MIVKLVNNLIKEYNYNNYVFQLIIQLIIVFNIIIKEYVLNVKISILQIMPIFVSQNPKIIIIVLKEMVMEIVYSVIEIIT